MLKQAEQDIVLELLIRYSSPAPSPRQALVAGLNSHLAAKFADDLPNALSKRALDLCLEDGHRCSPPSLVKLLKLIEPLDPIIPKLIEHVRTPPPASADNFESVVLDIKEPFLARQKTRANLRALLAARPLKPVVVINGSEDTGKTHTTAFIQHVLRDLCAIQHCIISFDQELGPAIGPKELASDIVTQLGGDARTIVPPCTNGFRWAQELANCVISEGNRQKRDTWWIVLDGFRDPNLREDTKQFIVKFAAALMTGVAQEKFRLILLDFDSTALTIPPNKIADEQMTPIAANAVAKCVDELAPHLPSSERKTIVARVLQGVSDPIDDLPTVAGRLREVIRVFGDASASSA
jgi:hypothetical protein